MIISDTSPLILLAKIDMLNILLDEIKSISITDIIYDELMFKKSFEVSVIFNEIKNNRILIHKIDKKLLNEILQEFKLDDGEASAYLLYKKNDGKLIFADDRELIKLCKIEQIPFVCTLAIIIRLYEKKKINKKIAIEKLDLLNSYGRYSKEVFDYFQKQVI